MGNAWVFPSISHSTGKCNKTHRMERTWEIGNLIFPIVWVFFSYSIIILQHTSLHGKYMGFPISFPQHEKMQQNPLYVEDLASYLSHSMGAFFPLDSHTMILFITWEMYGFFNQFPIAWENPAKTVEWAKPGKLAPILFPQYGCFFPLDSHPVVYFII